MPIGSFALATATKVRFSPRSVASKILLTIEAQPPGVALPLFAMECKALKRSYDLEVVHDGAWRVAFNGREFGPFSNKDAALEAATAAVSRATDLGAEARVVINA